MATLTAPNSIPDFEHEYHTVIIDNLDHSSNTDFTAYLPTPLENIVQAQLVAATISTSGDAQRVLHIDIEELRSRNTQRACATTGNSDTPWAASADNHLDHAFASIMCQHVLIANGGAQKAVFFRNEYPIIHQYQNPIRKLDRLTFNIDKQDGTTAAMGASVFVFKFVCKNRNLPFAPAGR